MKYKYYHDAKSKTVYRVPETPTISEKTGKNGNVIIWNASMEIEITRADNVLSGRRWKYPILEYPTQSFENYDNRYSRERVIGYFHQHHDPKCDQIDEEQYTKLKNRYERTAGTNK